MRVLKVISFIGLSLNIVPAVMVFNGMLQMEEYKLLMLIGTIMWFATAPFWINKNETKKNQK